MEFLKGVLSEETYTKLEAELKDKKDVKLGNLATGEYVNKAKYDEAVANTTHLQSELSKRTNDLTELQKNSKLTEEEKKELDTLKNLSKSFDEKLKEAKKLGAIDVAIVKANAMDDVSVKAHLSEFIKTAEYNDQTGEIKGLDEHLKTLRESKPYLFDGKATGQRHNPNDPKNDLTKQEQIRAQIYGAKEE